MGWSNLSCPLCKWAIKVLITGGLTLAGVPIPADSDILSELLDNLGDVIETFADTEYADVWDTIRDVLDWAQDALDALDRFLAEVCRRLGACP